MREIKAIIQPFMVEKVLHALAALEELPGVTVSQVVGWGRTRGADADAEHRVQEAGHAFAKKTKLEIVVPDRLVLAVVDCIAGAAQTGRPGDGKIFVLEVDRARRIRTGEEGEEAL